MLRKIVISIISSLVFVSCSNITRSVVLWEFDDSRLFLNSLDTCWKIPDKSLQYDMYLSLRHKDDFNRNALKFKLTIDELTDTILFPLVDTNNMWTGTPYVGSYVTRTKLGEGIEFNSDSIFFSITPVSSNALNGIDWLAIELEVK